ncbi:MAG: hypothetical protein ACPG7U_01530 [Holosporaceae bacterium]
MKKIYNMGVLCFACLLGTTQIGLATSPRASDSDIDHDLVEGRRASQNSGNSPAPQSSAPSSGAPFGEIPPNQEVLLGRVSSLSTGPSQASVATQPDSPPLAQAQLKITPTKRQRDGSSEKDEAMTPSRKKRRTKEENAEDTATSAEVQEMAVQLRKQISDFLLQGGGGIPFIETGVLVEAVMNSGLRPSSHQQPITDDEAMCYTHEEGMHFNALKAITSRMWCELLSKTTLVISGSATVHQPVFNLSFLNTLCLVNCSVVKELPTAPHLKTLVLHGCTVIPPIQDQPGLKTLDIASDTTNGQIPTLNNLPSLESLLLKGPVTEKGEPFIYSGSLKLLNLTKLVLDLEIGRPRFNVMGPLPNLQTLHIKSADLTDYQISDGLAHYTVLKTLVLENYYGNLEITHRHISQLTVVCSDVLLQLGQLPNLESLYLSGVDTQDGFEPLMAPENIGPYPYLKDIVLRHCVTTAIVHKTPYLRCLRVEGVNSIKKLQNLPSLESLSLDFHVPFSKLTLNKLPALSELCIHFLKRQNEAVDGFQLASFEQITEPGKLLSSALFIQVALPSLKKMNLTFGAHGEVDFDTLSEKDQAKVELSPVQKSKLPKLKTFRVYNLLSRT